MAKLTLSVESGGSLSNAVDSLVDHLPGFPKTVEGGVRLVHGGSEPAASGNPHFVAIEIDIPDLDEETLEALRPLFRTLAALVRAQSTKGVSASLTLDGKGGPVFYETFTD